ncbi:FAD binding domain-containing protein [Falsiroseomonas selenitidurans]|uniref:Xanthine dehydrogenase family protein subunit M n=1 Tax=Falsiroseomonas selenitidurans TaxID=2716335 RepID=A0ABX1DWF6_9PROT|nr:FAD binding domain-containing protein [Falsiroseomonas selenitidurans]NKC29254.1 xanthine dehydrogenase family protein subunit M [Falsiroseomonas selenitidurans]
MKPAPFAYARAASLPEVFDLLDRHGESARLLAGGQSLVAALNLRLSSPGILLDINGVEALRGIGFADGVLRIGALTRHAELGADPLVARHAPLLARAVPHIAHAAIRTRGTIGGSLALADPAAELPACALALDATLVLASRGGERRVAAVDFFQGLYQTALRGDEVLAAVEIASRAGQACTLQELARRHGDYAIVGLAAQAGPPGAGVALAWFGVGGTPLRTPRAEAALVAGDLAGAQAALAGEIDPPADLHGPPALRHHLARVLLGRAAAALKGH